MAGHAGLALILTFAVSLLFPEDPRAVIEGSILGFVGLLFCLAGVIAGSGRRCGLLGLIAAAIAVGLHAIFATAA